MKKPRDYRLGEKITFTVIETAPYFHIMTIRNDATGQKYVCDMNGRGPLAWDDETNE